MTRSASSWRVPSPQSKRWTGSGVARKVWPQCPQVQSIGSVASNIGFLLASGTRDGSTENPEIAGLRHRHRRRLRHLILNDLNGRRYENVLGDVVEHLFQLV